MCQDGCVDTVGMHGLGLNIFLYFMNGRDIFSFTAGASGPTKCFIKRRDAIMEEKLKRQTMDLMEIEGQRKAAMFRLRFKIPQR